MTISSVKTAMAALFEEVAESTSINYTLSKKLRKWDMQDLADHGRTAPAGQAVISSSINPQDIEWIPQEFRYTANDGYDTSGVTAQSSIRRMIPVNRARTINIKTSINVFDLRDPMNKEQMKLGMVREITNKIDTMCFSTLIREGSIAVNSSNAFNYQLPIDAETEMHNRGLSAYDRIMFLSVKDYNSVAKTLGQNQYYGVEGGAAVTLDALTKAKVPDLGSFETYRSDYLMSLAASGATNVTVNGADQDHTVATYNSSGLFQDNRRQTLTLNNITAANFPAGTKFTIAGVNSVHEETREDTGDPQTFTVVVAHASAPTIQPAIISSGVFQNCSATPANAATVTILNTAVKRPSIFFTPESTVLIPGRLPPTPDESGVGTIELVSPNGLPMRLTYWYDGDAETLICKILVFFDVQVIYPNQAGVILSA